MNLFSIVQFSIATLLMLCTSNALLLPSSEIYYPNLPNITKCVQSFNNKSVDCRSRHLTEVPRDLYPDIQKLFFSGNKVSSLRNSSFQRYPKLTELHMDGNVIESIEGGAFRPLRHLKKLILSKNLISVISGDAFQWSDELQHLDLSRNEMETFPSGIMELLPNLKLLFLQVNKIRSVNITRCGTNRKQAILLMGNDIQKLTHETFAFTCVTDSLFMDYNPIVTIDSETIAVLPVKILTLGGFPLFSDMTLKKLFLGVSRSMIEEVWIKNAYVSDIAEDLFDSLCNKSLSMLCLRHNKLQLYHSAFSKLPLLSALDISDCNLKTIEPEYFDGMMGLQYLYLNNNKIEVVNPHNSMWKINLHILDLSVNTFQRINQSALNGLFNLTSLSLRLMNGQNIPSVYIDLRKIFSLDLSSSYVSKLKLTTPLLKSFSYGDIQEMKSWPFYGKRVFQSAQEIETIYLASAQLTTDDIWYIYDRFSLFDDLYNLTHLNISHNNFKILPSPVFRSLFSLRVLDIAHCKVKVIQRRAFDKLITLQTLNLINNEILSTPTYLLANMKYLVNLHLDSNSLGYLDESFFLNLQLLNNVTLANNRLVAFNRSTFDPIHSSVNSIDISGNLLMCNCDSRWLVEQLGEFLIKENETICSTTSATLEPLRGKTFNLFNPKEYCRTNITLYCLIFVAVLVLCITLIISYHHRWLLRYKLFLLKLAILGYREIRDARNNEEFEYDINVMFMDNDTDWAAQHFRPALQDMVPNFERIAFGDDDLVLGMHYFDAVYYNVENSFKSVLLISQAAVRDHIFMTKFRIAMNHVTDTEIENMILVFLEDIPDEDLPYLVRLYLSGQAAYLNWEEDEDGQEYFWNKLSKYLKVNLRINHMVPPE